MDGMIEDLLEVHQNWGGTCSECQITNDVWESESAPWPCNTVEVILKHYPDTTIEVF